jgi:hypothetical protein
MEYYNPSSLLKMEDYPSWLLKMPNGNISHNVPGKSHQLLTFFNFHNDKQTENFNSTTGSSIPYRKQYTSPISEDKSQSDGSTRASFLLSML